MKFVKKTVHSSSTPAAVRSAIITEMRTKGTKEAALDAEIAKVLNTSLSNAQRITAMKNVIKVAKGE